MEPFHSPQFFFPKKDRLLTRLMIRSSKFSHQMASLKLATWRGGSQRYSTVVRPANCIKFDRSKRSSHWTLQQLGTKLQKRHILQVPLFSQHSFHGKLLFGFMFKVNVRIACDNYLLVMKFFFFLPVYDADAAVRNGR